MAKGSASDGSFTLPENVKAGDLVTLRCPPGSTVPFKVGDTLSKNEKGEATTKVIRIEGQDILVGALKATDFNIQFECPGSSQKVSSQFRVIGLKKEELPEAAPPLAPLAFTYPLWFWLLIAAIVLAFLGMSFWLYKKILGKLAPPPKAAEPKTLNPIEAFAQFLTEAKRSKVTDKSDDASMQFLYGQGYERLRKFLEYHYELKTIIETTREFLGSLKAIASRVKLPMSAVDAIDGLLTNADRVRFAKAQPPVEENALFLKRLTELFDALKPKETKSGVNDEIR